MGKIKLFDSSFTLEEINEIYEKEGEPLKTGNRSEVKLVEYRGKNFIVKIPVEKNRRKWQRLLSIFRKHESLAILESMEFLLQNGVATNHPVACFEERKWGMVVFSYSIYSFISGEIVTAKESREVIEIIKKIHRTGFLHGDTQVRNFLKAGDRVVVIDAKLKSKIMGKISENLEYIGFGVDIKEAYNHIDIKSIWFKIAKFLYELFRLKRRVRHYFKKKMAGGK